MGFSAENLYNPMEKKRRPFDDWRNLINGVIKRPVKWEKERREGGVLCMTSCLLLLGLYCLWSKCISFLYCFAFSYKFSYIFLIDVNVYRLALIYLIFVHIFFKFILKVLNGIEESLLTVDSSTFKISSTDGSTAIFSNTRPQVNGKDKKELMKDWIFTGDVICDDILM